MRFYPDQFNDLIWIYDEHSIRILYSREDRLYFEVGFTRTFERKLTEGFIPGFGDRLLGELKRIAPKEVKIKISAPRERLYSTWIG